MDMPVYKCPVFWSQAQSLTWLSISTFLKAPLVPSLLPSKLWVISSNTRDSLLLQVLTTSSILVQVILSRPIEALTSTIGMIPVQNLEVLFELGILLLGKNWNRVDRAALCLIAFVIYMIRAFDWLVLAINLGKYWTYISAFFLPPC